MSKNKKTHEDCMATICGICLRKFPGSDLRGIGEADLALIKKHIFAGYDLTMMPKKACKSCKVTVSYIEKNGTNSGRKRPNVDYEGLRLPSTTATRQQKEGCPCSYCHIGRMKCSEYTEHVKDVVASVGRPPADDRSPPPVAESICSFCKGKQTIYFLST